MLLSGITCSFRVEAAIADEAIYIKADGSIVPTDSPISTTDNITYILTGNISAPRDGIVIERNNTIIDGNGYTLLGSDDSIGFFGISITNLNNVTIRNFEILNFMRSIDVYYSSNIMVSSNNMNDTHTGVDFYLSSDCMVSGNNFTCKSYGLSLDSSSGNILSNNNITVCQYGLDCRNSSNNTVVQNNFFYNYLNIVFWYSSGNRFFRNNFSSKECVACLDDTISIHGLSVNIWDDGLEGNYWSRYNGTDSNHDGIGNIPYVIDVDNIDHYPLMYPYGSIQNLNTSLIYLTIQQAIDADETLNGHVIHIKSGTYEMIYAYIDKSVSLLGEGMESTTVIGISKSSPMFPIFDVFSDHVIVSGFTLTEGYAAVHIRANYAHITNCNISDNSYGIYGSEISGLFGAVTIDGNIIANNNDGVRLSTWSNVISNNVIFGNSIGIMLGNSEYHNNNTRVFGNTIENNQKGIFLKGSYGNTLFHNNFINNTVQVSDWSIEFPYVGNSWTENYWSDYEGTGNTPYLIDGANQDPYPLMSLYEIPEYHPLLFLLLFVIATLFMIVVYKRKHLT
jgi:parallel beta-helix repeat protein